MIARVVLAEASRAFDGLYDYLVPENLEKRIRVGQVVLVPFARWRQPARAYVIELLDESDSKRELKSIDDIQNDDPVIGLEQRQLAHAMRQRYFTSHGRALDAMVPPRLIGVGERRTRHARLVDAEEMRQKLEEGDFRSQGHVRVVQLLLDYESMPVSELRQIARVSESVIATLRKNRILAVYRDLERREPPDQGRVERDTPPRLTAAQARAVAQLEQAVQTAKPGQLAEFLLYGVTGSGKTEVYLQLAERVLKAGRGVMVLVPEIGLTPQMVHRLTARFGDRAAILHSRLTLTERYAMWQSVRRGERHIVVGARSAVFAPQENIGLIVVDEEQDGSYKSNLSPRYHALDLARMRARLHGAVLLLGSATPSLEAWTRVEQGKSRRLDLPERVGRAGRPRLHLIDMKKEMASRLVSRPLEEALALALARGEQALIFVNRRGFQPLTVCSDCGAVLKCGSCDVALNRHINLHRADGPQSLICHHCDRMYASVSVCPTCQSQSLIPLGFGTQQVESWLGERFPQARLLRMDQDSTLGRDAHQTLLETFREGQADILIGTQMVAKGHDFPRVTVVGILSADQLLNTGDYRASENGFALITQAAGRAGRADLSGDVFIQAYDLNHYALKAALRERPAEFYKAEDLFRRRLGYPPHGHLGVVQFSGFDVGKTERAALDFALALGQARRQLPAYSKVEVGRPAPSPIARRRNRYRFRLILKSSDRRALTELMALVDDQLPVRDVTRVLDINPQTML